MSHKKMLFQPVPTYPYLASHCIDWLLVVVWPDENDAGGVYEMRMRNRSEMQKAASVASALVLFFSTNCANFWPVYAQNLLNMNAVLC